MQRRNQIVLVSVLIVLLQLLIACSQLVTAQNYNLAARGYWQYAASSAPPGLMQQVIQENIKTDWLGDPGRMKIFTIQETGQEMPFYLIDSQIQDKCPPRGCDPLLEPLCGSAGCAYLGYIQESNSYRQVFKQYLKSSLPPGVPFLRISDQLSLGLPCLEFAELPNVVSADNIRVSRFCYDGQQYVLRNYFYESLPQD